MAGKTLVMRTSSYRTQGDREWTGGEVYNYGQTLDESVPSDGLPTELADYAQRWNTIFLSYSSLVGVEVTEAIEARTIRRVPFELGYTFGHSLSGRELHSFLSDFHVERQWTCKSVTSSDIDPVWHSAVVGIVDFPVEDPLDIRHQLESLEKLKDGWADGIQPAVDWGNGYGLAPSAEGLEWLGGRLDKLYEQRLPKPYLYPTPEGGVEVEWSMGPIMPSLEIDLITHGAEWHCLDTSTGHSYEHDLELDTPEALEWLANELRRLEMSAR